jgi:aryl-alcohol dehydrogenase-like predicted oxidoreductase
MRKRNFGRLGTVSALTLGGGGIGGVWGSTDRDEAVSTVLAAIDAGITHVDVAPGYGTGFESEHVLGDARLPSDVLITTKVPLPDDEGDDDPAGTMTASLHDSLRRIGRDHLDLFLLHSQFRPVDGSASAPHLIGWKRYRDEVVPAFERLRDKGTIRAWGITGAGYPQQVLDAVTTHPRPDAAQVVVNAMDMSGDMWLFGSAGKPRNAEIVETAHASGVSVIAIRAVAAGSLSASLDRPVDAEHPAARDFARAEPFRKLAAELGETPTSLAHRYALSVPGVATVVLGVKNRAELAECVAAEERGPLTDAEMRAVLALRV